MAEAQSGGDGSGEGSSRLSRPKATTLKYNKGDRSPCGACQYMKRRCDRECIFAPFFDVEQGSKYFEAVHKVFGARNISKLLENVPENKRNDMMITLVYEAEARVADPVNGCVSTIEALKQQVNSLQGELAMLHNVVMNNRFQYTSGLQSAQEQQEPREPNMIAAIQPHSALASTNLMNMNSFNPCFDLARDSTPSLHSLEDLVQFSGFFQAKKDGEEQSIIPSSSQPKN